MERGLYIAASGMVSEMARQDLIANDLANASTPGYKADRAIQSSFGQMLLQNTQTGQQVGPLGQGSRIDEQVTDFSASPVRETGEPLDFAVVGEGWFAVQTDQGTRYTRNGQFMARPDRTLVTAQGDPVLGQNGRPLTVGADGKVDAAQLGLFNLNNPVKSGDSLVAGTAAGRGTGQVRDGAIEASGADPTKAMVDMIASLRAYEAGQKVITTIDSTLDRAANRVGSLS